MTKETHRSKRAKRATNERCWWNREWPVLLKLQHRGPPTGIQLGSLDLFVISHFAKVSVIGEKRRKKIRLQLLNWFVPKEGNRYVIIRWLLETWYEKGATTTKILWIGQGLKIKQRDNAFLRKQLKNKNGFRPGTKLATTAHCDRPTETSCFLYSNYFVPNFLLYHAIKIIFIIVNNDNHIFFYLFVVSYSLLKTASAILEWKFLPEASSIG